jgi:hypothetical protein
MTILENFEHLLSQWLLALALREKRRGHLGPWPLEGPLSKGHLANMRRVIRAREALHAAMGAVCVGRGGR